MDEQKDYEQIKAEYETSTDMQLVEWARPYFEGTKKPNDKDMYVICKISDKAANEIKSQTGCDVFGFSFVIKPDAVRHTDKRHHGKQHAADNTVKDVVDFGRIAYVLQNYDEICDIGETTAAHWTSKHEQAKVLYFVKRIDGFVFAAQALTDSQKNKRLFITSIFRGSSLTYLEQKKSRKVDALSPQPNVQNASDSVTSILPQPKKNVNSLNEKSSEPQEPKKETNRERYKRMQKELSRTGAKKSSAKPPKPPGGSGSGSGK